MQKTLLILLILVYNLGISQKIKSEENIRGKFESMQPQDFSVPLPPKTLFPAQFPQGNKFFIESVQKNLDQNTMKTLPSRLITKITLKIDFDGNVINISTYGNNEIFNKEVKKAAEKVTNNIKWEPGKNSQGEKVIDIVRLPFQVFE